MLCVPALFFNRNKTPNSDYVSYNKLFKGCSMMKNIAVYPGTFDPITLGHVDLIERAGRIFDRIIVAIAANKNKNPCFSLNERIELATEALKKYNNVQVVGFDELLINFMRKHDANIILRGMRVVSDFDYEFQLAGMNRHLASDIESLFLMPAENYTYISSSFVREIAFLKGDVSPFVPKNVVAALKEKLNT
jgi:pantetheine-phosphate adenylyltransferase